MYIMCPLGSVPTQTIITYRWCTTECRVLGLDLPAWVLPSDIGPRVPMPQSQPTRVEIPGRLKSRERSILPQTYIHRYIQMFNA